MGRAAIGAPHGGKRAWSTLLGGFLLLAAPAGAQEPRLPYLPLAPDIRLSPDDMALDMDDAPPLTPAQTRAMADRLAALAVDQPYEPRPAIWRIRNRTTSLYLFGTIHVLPPGFRWLTPMLERIVAKADTLMVESVEDTKGSDLFTAPRDANGAALPPLGDRVSRDHRAALQRFMATLPPDAAKLLDGLPTWIASVAVSFVREVRSGETPGPGADDWLEQNFRKAGKPVLAIEDGGKVLVSISAIPVKDQQAMLNAALDAPAFDRAKMRAPAHAWAKGEIGAGSALTVDLAATGSSPLAAPLLEVRNRAWAVKLEQRMKIPGTVLFAAGAGHFIGDKSVIALLRKRGIKVTRVE